MTDGEPETDPTTYKKPLWVCGQKPHIFLRKRERGVGEDFWSGAPPMTNDVWQTPLPTGTYTRILRELTAWKGEKPKPGLLKQLPAFEIFFRAAHLFI